MGDAAVRPALYLIKSDRVIARRPKPIPCSSSIVLQARGGTLKENSIHIGNSDDAAALVTALVMALVQALSIQQS